MTSGADQPDKLDTHQSPALRALDIQLTPTKNSRCTKVRVRASLRQEELVGRHDDNSTQAMQREDWSPLLLTVTTAQLVSDPLRMYSAILYACASAARQLQVEQGSTGHAMRGLCMVSMHPFNVLRLAHVSGLGKQFREC